MALFDLADVTRTVIGMIEQALVDTGHWTAATMPKVFADLPNRVKKDGLGFFLFHVQESDFFKNLPAPGKDQPPVGTIPMGLRLYYQLCANSTADDGQGPLQEQLLMGVAMKALHDNPQVPDTAPPGNNNRFRVTLQPLAPNEAVQYWTAGESPVKLSAFYEVSVIFLEPKKPASYAGRVLTYGNYIFTRGAPWIVSSQNTLSYLLPGGLVPKQVVIQPAQAPPASVLPPPQDSIITFTGGGFGGGTVDLWIIHPRWPVPAVATPDWQLAITGDDQLSVTVRETAKLRDSATIVDMLPGLYAAQISITESRLLPDGTTKVFRHVSNQFPFSISPRIGPAASGGGIFTVTGWVFQGAGLHPEDIQVYLGETSLAPDGGGFNPGEFRITAANTLQLKAPAAMPAGPAPLRILVLGVESPPQWVTI
ncbi:MAG TPA: DUF4255 domain-containing protein [Puia sp.]|nr:DUF4255 domain-containing protein [Puia sp.]